MLLIGASLLTVVALAQPAGGAFASVLGRGIAHLIIYLPALALYFIVLPRFYGFSTLGQPLQLFALASLFVLATSFIALQRLGLKRDDVTVSQIGGSSQRFGALLAGRIDAAPLLEPTIAAAKQKGFVPLLDLAAANTPWIFDGVVVTNGYLKEHRDALTHFVRAYIAGAYLALSDVDKAKALIAQKYKTSDPTVIDATYNDFKGLMPLDAAPSIAGANNVIAQLQAVGLEVSKNVNDYVDLSIVEGLKKDGYFEQMAKTYPVKQ